jgi:FtsP/CotA-like multicopper oxidase with cupredoxin domain
LKHLVITKAAALFALLACSVSVSPVAAQDHRHPPAPAPASQAVFPPGPPVLVNTSKLPHTVEVTMTASPARLSLVPGPATDVFAYNGRVPGPTLEIHEGDHVIVHFRNELPEPTTIHWHGLHVPVEADGSPFYLVNPGKQYDYVFNIRKGMAGTYWYHPHPHHHTGYQIEMGLFGAIVIRAADDPLPASLPEKLIILADNRFRPDGSVDFPDEASPEGRVDLENGREGNIVFVNGRVTPTISIRSGEVQRWRVINASAARVFRLSIPGQTFLHVGSDGGLFEHPVEAKEILLANSERAEVLVRGTGAPGSTTHLQSLPYDRYMQQTRPSDWDKTGDLLTLVYTRERPVAAVAIPTTLRPIPVLDTMQVTERRVIVLTQGLINGKAHDMNRVDISSKLGAMEIWDIENLVGMDHNFHLHGFQFQVLDRNGVPEKSRRWKDTVNLPKHETARIIVRFDDHPGKWMFHCHILEHEDHGMMGVLEVK